MQFDCSKNTCIIKEFISRSILGSCDYKSLYQPPQKALIVINCNYIRKINNITPYVPRLDLNVNIGLLSLPVRFRRE